MERFMPRNTLYDIRCDRWGLSQRERKKNPRASESTLTWGQHTNCHNTDFPSLQNQTQPDHGVVEEVTACSVGDGAACKAWGFPYFLLHVIIYFLKLNHALLMVQNARIQRLRHWQVRGRGLAILLAPCGYWQSATFLCCGNTDTHSASFVMWYDTLILSLSLCLNFPLFIRVPAILDFRANLA